MKLQVLGSSSKGNCYLLRSADGHDLILEAGVDPKQVKQALGWKLSQVAGVLCTHRHSDHARHLRYWASLGLPVYTTPDVISDQRIGYDQGYNPYPSVHKILPECGYHLKGGFSVYVLAVRHDVPCVGFLIDHKEMGRLLFLTDTMTLDYVIPSDTTHILIEANYADALLDENILEGSVPVSQRERLLRSHMELETTAGILRTNSLPNVLDIVLLHLSDRNADPELFRTHIQRVTRRETYVAVPGLELSLGTLPF
jgi:phosphoribosyl 1,2-cyclic phosphodiesterase